MTYSELKQVFRDLKRNSPKEDLTAHIIFTEDSFDEQYPLLSRTYSFNSDNKAFWPNMGGYSIFAYCLDKTSDQGVRLDWYMAEEGNAGGWKIEGCYILEQMRDVAAIGYDYDKAVKRCERRRAKGEHGEDTGIDGLEAFIRKRERPRKKEINNGREG